MTALKDPNVISKSAEMGTEPVAPERATQEALCTHLKNEVDKRGPVIKKADVYAD